MVVMDDKYQKPQLPRMSVKRFIWIVIGITIGLTTLFALSFVGLYSTPASNDLGVAVGDAYTAVLMYDIAFFTPITVGCCAVLYSLRYVKRDPQYFKVALVWTGAMIVATVVMQGVIQSIRSYESQRAGEQYTQSQIPYSAETCKKYWDVHASLRAKSSASYAGVKDFGSIQKAYDAIREKIEHAKAGQLQADTYCTSKQPTQHDLDELDAANAENEEITKMAEALQPIKDLQYDWEYVTSGKYNESVTSPWRGKLSSPDEIEVQGYKLSIVCQNEADHSTCTSENAWTNGESIITTAQLIDHIRAKLEQKDKEL